MIEIGVIFDMDGVLIDSYAAHLRSWRLLAEEIEASITDAQFAATFGRTSRDIIRKLFSVEDPAEVRRLDDRKERLYRDLIHGAVPAMPGAAEALERLRTAGFKLAVGSSGPPENVALVCAELGLDPFLAAVVTGKDVQRGKPDPQVFQLAAGRMAIEPRRCVVIEDAPAGIEAAHRAGMRCIALTGTHRTESLQSSDRVIRHLDQLTSPLVLELL